MSDPANNDLKQLLDTVDGMSEGSRTNCRANELVDYQLEHYGEHGRYWFEWSVAPKSPRNSVWLAQTSITSEPPGTAGNLNAVQAGVPSSVQPGLTLMGLSTDVNIRPGSRVTFFVTGYVQTAEGAHNQFCFEDVVVAGA